MMPSKKITSDSTLKYYDPKNLSLQTDPSLKGLGAVLFQEVYPVFFANRSLQPHQKVSVAIELKSLEVA